MSTGWIVTIVILGLIVLGLMALTIMNKVGHSTKEEQTIPLPGDDLIPENERYSTGTTCITIDAPPSKIWPYLAQMGQTKAGFYSYWLFENLVGCGVHNVYEIKPEWQNVKVGDWIFFHKGGVGIEVMEFKKNEYLVGYSDSRKPCKVKGSKPYNPFGEEMAYSWAFVLRELPGGKTRLMLRTNTHWEPQSTLRFIFLLITQGIPGIVMQQKLKRTIKALAENRLRVPW